MKKLLIKTFTTFLFTFALIVTGVTSAHAAGVVSVTFDDGFLSTYTNALPILSARNIKATIYPNTSSLNTGTQPDGFPALSWNQLVTLQNTYGWEVGGHSNNHTYPGLTKLTKAELINELTTSNADLAAHGLHVTNFASPFGDYNNQTLVEELKLYNSQRGFADRDALNSFPYNKAVLQVQSLEKGVTTAMAKGWIDQAVANNTWLILVIHDVQPTFQPNYEYNVTPTDLTTVANYIVSSGVQVKTVEQALQKSGYNVLNNSHFATGLTNWTTDNSAQITADSNNNGSYGDSQHSVKVTGGASAVHLFSDAVSAVPGANYLFEAFYNTMGLTAGELGFYIDEYDANGNWISGKWLGQVANNAVGYFSKLYTTTSNMVSKLSVQTYLTAGSTGTAYIDNEDLHNLDASGTPIPSPTVSVTGTGTPSVSPTATPTPVLGNNIVQNGSFETVTGSFADNWTTNNATVYTINTSSNGDNGTNALHVGNASANAHVFSALIPVTPGVTYTWSQFIKANTLTGEFGFYIDEYNSTGNWVSGQWKGLINGPTTTTKQFVYIPTSANVAQIGLQFYTISGTTADIYVDSVAITAPITVTPTGQVTVTPTVQATVTPTGQVTVTPTPSVIPTGSATITPTPTAIPSVTETPTPVASGNIVKNGSFETVSGNFPTNWTTSQAAIFALDTTSQGNNGANSIRVLSSPAAAHLFSEQIAVDQATYTWSQYVKALSLSGGEFGFYIDEYDANGNWISGQWKGAIYAPFTQIATFGYTPTSANVKKVGLQLYITAGTTANIFLDSVSLSK